jgi:glycerate 2-kinase
VDLKEIYLTTLRLCAPDLLVQKFVDPSMPHDVVAIGKCAGALLDGVAAVHPLASAFVAIPEGYLLPRTRAEVHVGGHPLMTAASFAAGNALLSYVDQHDDILFLISGGGSACVEVPLPPHTQSEVASENARLIASGSSIAQINERRRSLSAIKGGRLGTRVRGRAVTLVYSDVSTGAPHDVASGPVSPDVVIADNKTLVETAAGLIGERAVVVEEQIEGDVASAAAQLATAAARLFPGQILVAGGEPTVTIRGDGRGGRCCELAVRFAMLSDLECLFGSSDGVDGNSGIAGVFLPAGATSATRRELRSEESELRGAARAALARSDSLAISSQVGEPIMIAAAGNNLRDLFLVARD